jgi:hypothetical protein
MTGDPSLLRNVAALLRHQSLPSNHMEVSNELDRIAVELERYALDLRLREEAERPPDTILETKVAIALPARARDWLFEWSSIPTHSGEQPNPANPCGEWFLISVNNEGRCLWARRKESTK